MPDLLKDGGLGEVIERAGCHKVCYCTNRAKSRAPRNHGKRAGMNLHFDFDCPEFGHWSVRWRQEQLHPHGSRAPMDGPIVHEQWGRLARIRFPCAKLPTTTPQQENELSKLGTDAFPRQRSRWGLNKVLANHSSELRVPAPLIKSPNDGAQWLRGKTGFAPR